MNLQKHVIIIKGVNKTFQVESIRLDGYKYAIKFQNSDKVYSYSIDKVTWLTNPISVDFVDNNIFINGKKQKSISQIHLFTSDYQKYYAITFKSGFIKHYSESEIDIRRSCLTGKATSVFDYMRQCAGINTLGMVEDDESSEGILSSVYSKIDFVDDKTAAAVYLNPSQDIGKRRIDIPLFPFGCNASQERAVKTALSKQISVIQGPPGTGKTQTILNIIANLLIAKKSVLIVSNNNSATENIWEKLSKNGLGFLVAPLGKKENKEAFIANQPLLNPDLPSWRKNTLEINHASSEAKSSLIQVEAVFKIQERLAVCRQELAEVEIEKIHFKKEHVLDFNAESVSVSSIKILKILGRIKHFALIHKEDSDGLWNRIKNAIRKLDLELRLRFMLKIKAELKPDTIPDIITLLDWLFYIRRIDELTAEIKDLEHKISQLLFSSLFRAEKF